MLPVLAKIVSKIILERRTGWFSFRIPDHINTIRILIEQCAEHRSDLSMVFSNNNNNNRAVSEKIICIIRPCKMSSSSQK